MCARSIGIIAFVYRLCDHPNKDGIIQGITAAEKDGLVAICIHRKKQIYIMQKHDELGIEIKERSNNEIIIQIPYFPSFEAAFCQHYSPFFYIATGMSLFTFNIDTMESMHPLHLGSVLFKYIVGVHNGVITLMDQGKRWQLVSAQLPEGYYEKSPFNSEVQTVTQKKTGIRGFFGNLFKRSPPLSTEDKENSNGADIDNNANVVDQNPGNTKGSPMLDMMADPLYLAFKSSFKIADDAEKPGEFSSKFVNEFTFNRLRGGGSGCVFEVVSKNDNCEYAVKRIAVSPDQADKSQDEVFSMATLEHPGIVKYNCVWVERPPTGWQFRTDFKMLKELESSRNFKDDDVFIYIQMKLYKKSMADWLKDNQERSLRPNRLIKSFFKQIVSAVWYLHDNDIIHCDLKPSNILFDGDRLKLCALDTAMKRKIGFEDEISLSRHNVGSPLYMSPEQETSSFPRFTFKTDIFAMGLILAELCIVIKNDEERYEIFDSYRQGEPPNSAYDDEDEEAADFVAWLSNKQSRKRPSCTEILIHPFLQVYGGS
ncbi:hypothetical protein PMAYCL1PPCAC_08505 [Pristionchus mayeri]|uniref:Protein kinase domain-containing protein n=1 Tax=Pristionchus mayeri TaxID=1317129 RepID=A0AAN4ZJT6_9BILA|nr:hypothetical protein PMAYCL1PPCAC_08505 [Pristionchus mayeri]